MRELTPIVIKIEGRVKSSNLPAFSEKTNEILASINTELATDEDFVEAEENCKLLKQAEKAIDAAKDDAVKQAAAIESLFAGLDSVRATVRSKRLELEKKVDDRKAAIRRDALSEVSAALNEHLAAVRRRLDASHDLGRQVGMDSGRWIQEAGFRDAIKGVRTIASLNERLKVALDRAKVASSEWADACIERLQIIKAAGRPELFADAAWLATVAATADLPDIVSGRIREAEEAAKAAESLMRLKLEDDLHTAEDDARAAPAAEHKPRMVPAGMTVMAEHSPTIEDVLVDELAQAIGAVEIEGAMDAVVDAVHAVTNDARITNNTLRQCARQALFMVAQRTTPF